MQSLWESIFLSPRDEMSLQHYWVASISFLAVCSRYCSKPRSLLFHPLEVLEIPLSTGVVGETKVDINTSTTIIISCGIVQLSSEHMDLATSRVPPASCRLPIELLQRMYQPLSPIDFDAARHTCRLWLFASLDKTLLTSQLVSGGWQAAGQQDLQEASDYLRRKSCSNIGNAALEAGSTTEWILSQRLKTETRLLPEWRCTEPSTSYDGSKVSGRNIDVHANKFPTTAPSGPSSSNPLANFTVSGCSKFVLLAQDHVVFIYSLANFKAGMTPLTSIIFHRRIVNVSMDTSCGRYAVAILLEGRIGMCCEVAIGERNLPSINRVRPSMSLSDFKNIDVRTPSRPGRATRRQDQGDCASPSTAGSQVRSPRAPSYRRRHHTLRRSDNITFRRGSSLTLTDSNFHNGRGVEFNPPIPNISVNQFFPQEFIDGHANDSSPSHCPPNNMDPITGMSVSTELGARKMYKNLCSIQDPPTSVAICPQRQCVAFGCKTGVELHWIDALRGSPLSRWFPLAAPSDYLYFVPPRNGEQRMSDIKLRLISSAAGPEDMVDADHYRARPLSDGHILFTDSENGHVHLGSDKPGGPTKLRREVLCLAPSGRPAGQSPDCYAAGYEMRWGVRIVVAYGPKVFLYNLPPDAFQQARPTTSGFMVAQSDLAMDVAVDKTHRETRRLEGVQIYDVGDCVVHDIAVDTGRGRLKVWLFLQNRGNKREPGDSRKHAGWWSSSHNVSLHYP